MRHLQIQPARAKSLRADRVPWGSPTHVAEEKIDGWRFLMHLGGGLDRVYLTGRRTSEVTGVLSEKGDLVPELWPIVPNGLGYTVLDGEITVPGEFHDIAGFMNSSREKVLAHVERFGVPTYHAFDVLWFDGVDLSGEVLMDRRAHLDLLAQRGVTSASLSILPTLPPELSVYEEIVERGGEGVILKDLLGFYGERDAWIKVKKSHPLDVVVTGFTAARHGRTGKYHGQIGAAVVSVYSRDGILREVGRVSGMTDELRLDMTEHPERWIGSVIEIESQGWARERLRHPRFKRVRPDAEPRHATLAKMMRDLGRDDDDTTGSEQLPLL